MEHPVALAREERFAPAARTCRVSQPALPEGVRTLEEELGGLLVRRARPVSLRRWRPRRPELPGLTRSAHLGIRVRPPPRP
ncbi:LysR family transcriptional regulator [Streptomyces polyrhachis]|uniref:LysR family transcriptional regulator n=1 Tax=Streptomyces polyrhachis TaxID=1282885 RepID=A0ABW2GJ23_9ACTN